MELHRGDRPPSPSAAWRLLLIGLGATGQQPSQPFIGPGRASASGAAAPAASRRGGKWRAATLLSRAHAPLGLGFARSSALSSFKLLYTYIVNFYSRKMNHLSPFSAGITGQQHTAVARALPVRPPLPQASCRGCSRHPLRCRCQGFCERVARCPSSGAFGHGSCSGRRSRCNGSAPCACHC